MRLTDVFENQILDKPTPSVHTLALKYKTSVAHVQDQLNKGIEVELEHTSDPAVAEEIALDHLNERLDYYDALATIDEEDLEEVYPGQSSGKLKAYVKRVYGGKINCPKAISVQNDPDASAFYKRRAAWYRNLHCKGRKTIREDDVGAALTIFDIDDTLFKTDANIKVRSADGDTKPLSKEEFNNYILGPGEEFDYGEFKDSKLFYDTSKPIENIWKTATNTLNNVGKRPGSRVVIVTARKDLDDKDLFLDTFRKHGLDMSKVHVYRAGNINSGSSASDKKIVIRNLLKSGDYTETRLFDDHEGNLAAFLELSEEFPNVTFKAFPVGPEGKIGKPIILINQQ